MSRRLMSSTCITMALVGFVGIGTQFTSTNSTQAQQQVVPAAWEYDTATVKSEELANHLNRCAQKGFEVFSLERANSRLVQSSDNVNEIRTTEYQVTARRSNR